MKRQVISFFAMLIAIVAFAADKAEISFQRLEYDFGNIHANGGNVTATYEFVNKGKAPLVIVNVTNGGCGCTKPSYPKEPIRPGGKGVVKITFNPKGRKGEVNRSVSVKTNGGNKKLKFSGVIIP